MRRFGAVSVGTSAALLFLALAVVCSRPAGAQDAPPPPAGSSVPVTSNPTPPLPPVSGPSTALPPGPAAAGDTAFPTASVPPPAASTPAPPPTRREALKAKTIDQVMTRLAAIKDQQAELEKEKKEAEAVLKEKLKEQKEKLQKLGVNVDEKDRPPVKKPVVKPSVDTGNSG
jgi:hypothetical protein